MFITPQVGEEIARELKQTIDRDVNIMDRTGTIIASTDPRRVGQPHAAARRVIREGLEVLEVIDADGDMQAGINLPIRVDDRCQGVLGITGPADQVRVFGNIARKMAEILLAAMSQQQQRAQLERARNLFVEEWLFSSEPDWAALSLRGALLSVTVDCPRRVALLEPPAGLAAEGPPELRSDQLLRMTLPYLQGDEESFCAVVNRRILLLLGGSSLGRALRLLEEIQREAAGRFGAPPAGGLSTVSRGGEDLRRCYLEAKIAVAISARDGHIRQYSNSSLDFVLQNIAPKVKQDMLQTVFPPMDREEQAELTSCLELYFQHDGEIDRAAEAACIHPNTFRYRMQKVCQRTGYDLRRPRDAVMLYVALQFLS